MDEKGAWIADLELCRPTDLLAQLQAGQR